MDPKLEQEDRRSFQELSKNLILLHFYLWLQLKVLALISEKDGKNKFQWLFYLKHTYVLGGEGIETFFETFFPISREMMLHCASNKTAKLKRLFSVNRPAGP